MACSFDFIIVGGGPAGCVVASRLANSKARPSVLLLEAGGKNNHETNFVPFDRYTMMLKGAEVNWGYKSTPQTHLKSQQIDLSRGKGLGGGTAINFQCWSIGSNEDFEEWSRLVCDETWTWKNVRERFKKIENYHIEVPKGFQKYIHPKLIDHGTNGPLDLSYAEIWERDMAAVFEAAKESGIAVNPDINDGNPIGMGLGASTMYKGSRTTAAQAYLLNKPSNLTIITEAHVARVLMNGKTATGVQLADEQKFYANNEIILTAGAINTPQILMLSGIGPEQELIKHNIPVIHDLQHIGKNLKDHFFSSIVLIQKPDTNDRMSFAADEKAMALAREQYARDKTGRLTELNCGTPLGFLKDEAVYASSEFAALPRSLQDRLHRPTVPLYEFATHVPPLYLGDYKMQPSDTYSCALNIFMNPQSSGEVTLRSADPMDPPLIDLKGLTHPYDKRIAIESTRRLMNYLESPSFAKNTVKMVGCPKSKSDEDIWDHVSGNLFTAWHMSCTAMMGRPDDERASVDTRFRVFGIERLRIADLSVLPILPSCHTQSTAYLVGETAAEKLIEEYKLD